jgi:hypothetical protein
MYVIVSIPLLVLPFLGPYTLTSKFNDNSQLLFKITALCDVTPCSLVDRHQHICGTRCLHLQGEDKTKAVMKSGSSSDEIRLVPLKRQYEFTRLSHLRSHFTFLLAVYATDILILDQRDLGQRERNSSDVGATVTALRVPKHCLNAPTRRFRMFLCEK